MSSRVPTVIWSPKTPALALGLGSLPFFLLLAACEPSQGPRSTDSQTNWLRHCEIDAQCGSLECVCGVCTHPCSDDAACSDLRGAACIPASEAGAIAQCGGTSPALGLCLPRCEAGCAEGQMCVAGVCTPVPEPTASVSVDTDEPRQTLVGFGSTIAYGEGEITGHPERDTLYSAIFAELGLDVLRLRNRYAQSGDGLAISGELVAAATASLGRTPGLFLTLWSPPPGLKASGVTQCSGNPDTCTLSRTPGGAFDYDGFAAHWRASLEAYANVGIAPDYIGLQNNPDWVPASSETGEACRFLPLEGSTTVNVRGVSLTVDYPGLAEAITATRAALADLPAVPRVLAPETANHQGVGEYVAALDMSAVDAFAHHLYGNDPRALDMQSLEEVGALASTLDKPIFQTEMLADGLGTAMLIHHTTAVEGASAYLHQTLTSSVIGPTANPLALVGLGAVAFTLRDPYFAMRHYALHTDPGWTRVSASSTAEDLLATAWLSPDGDALTIVLVNGGTTPIDARLDVSSGQKASSEVVRTVFGGDERWAALGSLSPEGVVTVPARAVVTVALRD